MLVGVFEVLGHVEVHFAIVCFAHAAQVDYPDIDTVMDAVDAAEGIAVLAHPSEYHSMDLLRELCRNHRIRGIEVYHPRNTEEDKAEMLRLAEKYDLAVTGGTDYHGFYTTKKNPVGTFTTAESEFDKIGRAHV